MELLGIEMSLKEFDYLMCEQSKGKQLKVVDGKVVAVEYVEPPKTPEEQLEELRYKREPLLIAFDKYKTNVVYGIEEETTEEKIVVLEWYQKALNLDEDALENVPDKIKYYL